MDYYELGYHDRHDNIQRDISQLLSNDALEYGRGWIDQAFNSKEAENELS